MITETILNIYTSLTSILTWFINIDLVEFKMGALIFFILFIYIALWFIKVLGHRQNKGVKR